MASLQLTSKGEPETGAEDHPSAVDTSSTPPSPSSRSPSLSPTAACQHLPSIQDSPSIVVSQFDSSRRASEPRGTRSLGRSSRFAPYLGASPTTQPRRCSLPDAPADTPEREVPGRPSSTSPRMHPNTLRDVSINATRPPRLRKAVDNIESESDVPISSFARRRTPQSSPTTSTFPHRRRSVSSQNSFSPVLLPTLLPGLAYPSSPPSGEDMDVSELEDSLSSQVHDSPQPRTHQGLRLSSYRASSQPHNGPGTPSVRSVA